MARATTESGVGNTDQLTFQADGAGRIELPSSEFIADATMTRDGDNLVLETPSGEVAVIEGYFSADPAPLLASPDGSVLTANLVEAFVHSPMEYAARDTASDESPVGAVEEVKGNATVTRADGTVETISIGTPLYQCDAIQTYASCALNILLLDQTSMAISENARMAIDEYTYDPATESGTTNFSVLRGLFVFTSGLIGRDDPDDVKIDTPVGSIGIRGTIIAGNINPDGESTITVLEGAIVVTNGNGNITLSQAFETVKLGGFEMPMSEALILPAAEISARFAAVSAVNPSLFSTISDAVQEQQTQQTTPTQESQPDAPSNETAPTSQTAPVQNTTVASDGTTAPAPVIMTDPSVSGFGSADQSLPSASVVAGQTSGGVFETSSNSVPTTGSVPSAGVGSTATTAANSTGGTTSATTTTPSVADESQTSPTVINSGSTGSTGNTGGAAGGTTPTLTMTGGSITDIAAAGALVATISLSDGSAASFTNTTNPNFDFIITSTSVEVRLSTIGANLLNDTLDLLQLGNFDVSATTTDGTLNNTYTPIVTDANTARVINLDSSPSGVSVISDFGIDNSIGYSISALGDIDRDGFDDFVFTNNSELGGQNHSYIVYGSASGIATQTVGDINGVGAYRGNITEPMDINPNGITGATTTYGQTVVAGVGDINGDGSRDYATGHGLLGPSNTGGVALHSGSTVQHSSNYGVGGSFLGVSIDGAGDYNNDGYADIIAGASADGARFYYGNAAMLASSPFTIPDTDEGVAVVTGIGDWDGDGFSDFALSMPGLNSGQGQVRIYMGKEGGTFDTASFITLDGGGALESFGVQMDAIGDINGDGLSDLLVMNINNRGFIFFGGAGSGNEGNANVGISIPGDYDITNVSATGDFNGDGYDDFTISMIDATGAKSYVVFGRDGMDGLDIDARYLKDPDNAFEITYSGANDTDPHFIVRSIGDVNGDGYDDLAAGVPDANGATAGDGGIIIINGRSSGNITAGLNASADDQHLVGNAANNAFNDQNWEGVSMRGGAGNDEFHIGNMNFLGIHGGTGQDFMYMNGPTIDFADVDFENISGIEGIMFNDANQTITLTLENIFNLMKSSDNGKLYLSANGLAGANLILDDGIGGDGYITGPETIDIQEFLESQGAALNGAPGTLNDGGTTYDTFRIGGYTLLIDQTITVDAV